ncbi:MAG TPA: NAD(P)H-dependent oxidoreductase [Bryobacteraceae bacterium]|nr:NAD(P)H-dependent oxidoreductase [Bryobacteraceae bacterium]
MATLLRIDSSPFSGDDSFSRKLTGEFADNWRKNNPGGEIIGRDLSALPIPVIDSEWIGAAYTPEDGRTARQREILALSDELIAELHAADEYVIGIPMHNFGVPSSVKLWIDQISRVGKTFSYENGAPAGLLRGKRATFLVATGGVYTEGSPWAAMDFAGPYLRSVFGFLGVRDVHLIHAGGTAMVRNGVNRETILQPALESVRELFERAQA